MFAKNIFNYIIKMLIMNKFLVFFFLIFSFQSYSQFIVSTNYIEMYQWDDKNNEWGLDPIYEGEQYTFLEFDKEFTSMTLTSFETKTFYKLSNLKYHDEYDHYTYDAISDGGYESTLVVDLKSELPNVRFVFDSKKTTFLVRHTAKNWFDYEE